jgi:thimet oligopeptidase
LLKRINQARKYGKGTFYARQLLYARYDMALYDEHEKNSMALWEAMEGKTLSGHTKGTQFPGQFNHVMSSYAAGYYSYLWSEVLAMDMLSQFDGNLMNPHTGMRYRKAILARGSEAAADELVHAFLGRAPDNRAFFRNITGDDEK